MLMRSNKALTMGCQADSPSLHVQNQFQVSKINWLFNYVMTKNPSGGPDFTLLHFSTWISKMHQDMFLLVQISIPLYFCIKSLNQSLCNPCSIVSSCYINSALIQCLGCVQNRKETLYGALHLLVSECYKEIKGK